LSKPTPIADKVYCLESGGHQATLRFGIYWMGSADDDPGADGDEKPRHKVYLPEFWIARYPVTVAQWRAFVEATSYDTLDFIGNRRWFGQYAPCLLSL
jgi:formylglycine-generating enzyme required for sulfatase activity